MTELRNCARCGKVYAKTVRDICPECYRKEEEDFQKVYRFLQNRKNREATIFAYSTLYNVFITFFTRIP